LFGYAGSAEVVDWERVAGDSAAVAQGATAAAVQAAAGQWQ
jgi:hypothetical protein